MTDNKDYALLPPEKIAQLMADFAKKIEQLREQVHQLVNQKNTIQAMYTSARQKQKD